MFFLSFFLNKGLYLLCKCKHECWNYVLQIISESCKIYSTYTRVSQLRVQRLVFFLFATLMMIPLVVMC